MQRRLLLCVSQWSAAQQPTKFKLQAGSVWTRYSVVRSRSVTTLTGAYTPPAGAFLPPPASASPLPPSAGPLYSGGVTSSATGTVSARYAEGKRPHNAHCVIRRCKRRDSRLENFCRFNQYISSSSSSPAWRLSDVWRLSRTSGLSREHRGLGITKIGTEVVHVTITCDSDTTFKVKGQMSRSPGSFAHRCVDRLQRWAWDRVSRGKLLLRCRLLSGARRFVAHGGEEGRGHIVSAACLQLVYLFVCLFIYLFI